MRSIMGRETQQCVKFSATAGQAWTGHCAMAQAPPPPLNKHWHPLRKTKILSYLVNYPTTTTTVLWPCGSCPGLPGEPAPER